MEEMGKVVAIEPNVLANVEDGSKVIEMAEKQQTYEEIVVLLDQIIADRTVPKNIRKAAEDSKNILSGNDSSEVKISSAIGILDEITNDPNMPMYTRTQIWNAVSMLEQKRREL